MTTLYRTLGVRKTATAETIDRAYKKKARLTHPDRNGGDDAAFKAVNDAYAVLADPARRARYDETGDTTQPQPNHRLEKVVPILLNVLLHVLGKIAETGRTPKEEDVVKLMRDSVRDGQKQQQQQIVGLEKIRAGLTEAAGRLTAKADGDNLLKALAERETEQLAGKLAEMQEYAGYLAEALKELEGYSYRADRRQQPTYVFGGQTFRFTTGAG